MKQKKLKIVGSYQRWDTGPAFGLSLRIILAILHLKRQTNNLNSQNFGSWNDFIKHIIT
jgi:hypothetical protein